MSSELSCGLLGRTFTSIGRLSTDEQVLSMIDGHLTLTYTRGDDCGAGHQRKTIITLICNDHALVIWFRTLYDYCSEDFLVITFM